jgi:MULE transposase domain
MPNCNNNFFQFFQLRPFAFVLMERRTLSLYYDVFDYMDEQLCIQPGSVMIDYENAPRTAVQAIWPEAVISGCNFHYCQSLRRKARSFPTISQALNGNRAANLVLRFYMRLSLLPRHLIKDGISDILLYQQQNALKLTFRPFHRYFLRQWIKNVNPRIWCVSDLNNRTNNSLEAYNSYLKTRIPRRPNIYAFLSALQGLICEAFRQLIFDQQNGVTISQRSKLSEKLNKAKIDLEDRKINIRRFFIILSKKSL